MQTEKQRQYEQVRWDAEAYIGDMIDPCELESFGAMLLDLGNAARTKGTRIREAGGVCHVSKLLGNCPRCARNSADVETRNPELDSPSTS